jgi:GTP-binding protein HflX
VGVQLKRHRNGWDIEDSLAELAQLVATAGLEVAGQTYQRLDRYDPATLVGSGKVEELADLRADLNAGVVVFDDELSPRQLRNLEEALGERAKIVDRTGIILDIFAQHARTREGQLQVELAQYQYRLPRLTRAWTHLARQAGGGGARGGSAGVGLRGPGETQLESDRREIGRRIAQLKDELEDVRRQRRLHREQRRQSAIPVIALVGYTNAGKSTLLNALSGADVLVEDKLFATLDPTIRRVALPSGREVLLSDTVGFIQKLPTDLVAAFRATLEEINEADLLLHVVDVTHPNVCEQAETVTETLADLNVVEQPVVIALNKIDLLPDPALAQERACGLEDGVPISAVTGAGLDDLLGEIEHILSENLVHVVIRVPYSRGDLVALFHSQGSILEETHDEGGTRLVGHLPRRWLDQFRPYLG